ncbi:MAG: DNA mismatch repair endonuclease MutL [Eubacteriales bacterium]
MGRILVLDELTANKIAAGEVVERPASIVKELIENSIDAGSSRIEISVTDGGLTSLVVSDNGTGMDTADAGLAFERHATSKIKNAGDLDHIRSLGFRGEALPSIAAVSRLNLKTRIKEAVSGTEVVIEGGQILTTADIGSPVGTIVEVNDLFFNTPARKKHMKGPNNEAGHVSDIVNKIAMGYPHISFQLKSNGRVILKTPGKGDLLECIAGVYGIEAAREMLLVEAQKSENSISGYIGKPSLSRAARNHQIIYINGRYVRNRGIAEAVEKAYHSMLMVGRHPVFVLNIRVNPETVDVNVHPAKTEVRIAEAGEIESFVTSAVSQTLAGNRLIPAPVYKPVPKQGLGGPAVQQEEWKVPYISTASEEQIRELPESSEYVPELSGASTGTGILDDSIPREAGEQPCFPELRPIGQIDCTYIVAQGSDGMYLIDQHAAHERILYEKYMEKPDDFVASEQLLFSVALQLTFQETQVLNDHIISLTDLGFVVEHFGGETFLLRGVPAAAVKIGGREIFLDLLDYFSRNRHTISSKALREKLLITMACKSAIKANHKLGLPEMESLLGQLSKARNPFTCPHGRPTLIHFSGYDLEKRFKRVL